MEPFAIRTERLLLDQPGEADVDRIAAFCTDPAFETYMVTPWPYERHHAEQFVHEHVPEGWERDVEWTWALREAAGAPLLGVVGVRFVLPDVGYWLGAPHRGRGLMPEALSAAVDAVLARRRVDRIHWETRRGNVASARVAEKAGFSFLGEGAGLVPLRDGTTPPSWLGEFVRGMSHEPKPGWPAP